MTPTPDSTERQQGGEVVDEHAALIAAGFDDYTARCALKTNPDGLFCHAYFYNDGQWRFQTGGFDLHGRDGELIRCVLAKRLYAAQPAGEGARA